MLLIQRNNTLMNNSIKIISTNLANPIKLLITIKSVDHRMNHWMS